MLIEEPHVPITDLNKIGVPTLVIGGDHDVIRPEHTALIANSIPRSYLWILPRSGHSTPIIYKEEFNKKVEAFFSKKYQVIEGMDRIF